MVSTIPVAGTFSLNNPNEDSKERILFTLQVAVKQIHHCSCLRSEGDGLTVDFKEVKLLCESLDKALFHGLKCYEKGYWSFVKEFTHSSTVKFLEKLKHATTEVQYGRAWLSLALSECNLESYFRSFTQNLQILKKHYKSLALLCDQERMQLVLMIMAGLENVSIILNPETIKFGSGLSFFECSSYSQSLNIFENPEYILKLPKANLISDSEVLPCENASEVTIDFTTSPLKSPSESQYFSEEIINTLHKSDSTESNRMRSETVSPEELEMISRYINIDTENESKVGEDIEVVRTKVVRRTKRSNSQKPDLLQCIESSDSKTQSDESNSSLENRLSKATTDSGLCLETPCSSDNDSGDIALDKSDEYDCQQIAFHVGDFQQEFSVTFSTPKRKTSSANSMDSKSALEERGLPEGQEDPIKSTCASLKIVDRSPLLTGDDGKDNKEIISDENEEDEEEISIYDLHKLSCFTKTEDSKDSKSEELPPASETDTFEKQSLSSFASGKTEIIDIILEEIERLGLEKPESYDLKVGNNILLYFLVEIYEHEEENFYKIYCAHSNFPEGNSQRIYFLLSNKSIYFLKPGNNEQKFFKCGSVRYSSISYITVDLNYQGFKIMSTDKKCLTLYTADEELTRNILSNLELGIRRFIPKLPLPSVYTDATMQRIVLSKFIASELQCEKSDVDLQYYGLSRWEDYSSSNITPSGPVYQDYLMYRIKFVKDNKATPWKPAFFMLKGGVLYCMEEEKSKPLFFIQMCAPHCKGCRRIHLLNRPHAFEIIRSDSDSLQLAASDTLEASKWLQYFLETVSLAGHFIDTERNVQRPCCVLVANKKILIATEDVRKSTYKHLNKAKICDLVSVFVDLVTPNFMMLEFEIAEASKSSGEWILYFESSLEKEKFLDIISHEWSEIYHVDLNIENIKDLYMLKKYRQFADELNSEKLALEEFCQDN